MTCGIWKFVGVPTDLAAKTNYTTVHDFVVFVPPRGVSIKVYEFLYKDIAVYIYFIPSHLYRYVFKSRADLL